MPSSRPCYQKKTLFPYFRSPSLFSPFLSLSLSLYIYIYIYMVLISNLAHSYLQRTSLQCCCSNDSNNLRNNLLHEAYWNTKKGNKLIPYMGTDKDWSLLISRKVLRHPPEIILITANHCMPPWLLKCSQQRKNHRSTLLALCEKKIQWWQVDSPHNESVMRKEFLFYHGRQEQ